MKGVMVMKLLIRLVPDCLKFGHSHKCYSEH